MIGLLRRGFDEELTTTGVREALQQHAADSSAGVDELATVVEQFLRGVPDAIACAVAMSKDKECGRAIGFATGSILTYLLDEDDLFPETEFGALGLLDDAYLVHAYVALLVQAYPFAKPEAVAYDAPDERSFDVVASLLPQGLAESLRRTCGSTIQVAQAFFPAVGDGVSAAGQQRPSLRVDEAAQLATGAAST
jgi:uncharacterized membrane protein YkvA (DUF1232 family)